MKLQNGQFVVGNVLDRHFKIYAPNVMGLYWNGSIYIILSTQQLVSHKIIPLKYIKKYIISSGIRFPAARKFTADNVSGGMIYLKYFPKISNVPKFIRTLDHGNNIQDNIHAYFKIMRI